MLFCLSVYKGTKNPAHFDMSGKIFVVKDSKDRDTKWSGTSVSQKRCGNQPAPTSLFIPKRSKIL